MEFSNDIFDSSPYKEKIKKRNKSYKNFFNYITKNRAPTYSKFEDNEFSDKQGREYKRVEEKIFKSYSESDSSYKELPYSLKENYLYGKILLIIKLPIKLRGTVKYPEIDDKLELMEINTQLEITGKVEAIFCKDKKKTGIVIIDDFKTYRQTTEPLLYLKQEKKEKSLF